MKRRCRPDNRKAHVYHDRGIEVCREWLDSFESFLNWAVSTGFDPKLTLDRIDNDKGYTPDNCRWATYLEQNRNLRKNIYLTYRGDSYTLRDACARAGVYHSGVLRLVAKTGCTHQQAFDYLIVRHLLGIPKGNNTFKFEVEQWN
jgi:hypothetical protein